jgi:hypothetical protein
MSDRRLIDNVSAAVVGLCATALASASGFMWLGLQDVTKLQVAHGQQLTHIAETIAEMKGQAERERNRLDAYMPRTEIESKLDVLRTAHGDHGRRIDRLETRSGGAR